jgi:hypothetical protein
MKRNIILAVSQNTNSFGCRGVQTLDRSGVVREHLFQDFAGNPTPRVGEEFDAHPHLKFPREIGRVKGGKKRVDEVWKKVAATA